MAGVMWGAFTCVRWRVTLYVIPYGKWRPIALRWSVIKSYIGLYLFSYLVHVYGTSHVTSSLSPLTFKQRLKMHLFRLSFPGLTFNSADSWPSSWPKLEASPRSSQQAMDWPATQGQQQHATSWPVEKIHHTWSYGSDATVLDDYVLTTTTTTTTTTV